MSIPVEKSRHFQSLRLVCGVSQTEIWDGENSGFSPSALLRALGGQYLDKLEFRQLTDGGR